MIRVGILDRISNFFQAVVEEIFPRQFEELEEPEDDQVIEEGKPGAPIGEDIIYQRKIIKTGSSDKRQTRTVQLFAFTFEDNFTDRFEELAREIQRYANSKNLFIVEDINELLGGYDDQSEFSDPPFTWPIIEVGEE